MNDKCPFCNRTRRRFHAYLVKQIIDSLINNKSYYQILIFESQYKAEIEFDKYYDILDNKEAIEYTSFRPFLDILLNNSSKIRFMWNAISLTGQNANSIILQVDQKGKINFINEFAQKYFALNEKDVIGKSLVGVIIPRLDLNGNDNKKIIKDILKDPKRYSNYESEVMLADGERSLISWTNKPLKNKDGNIAGIICVGNDITERKRSQERRLKSEKRYRYDHPGSAPSGFPFAVISGIRSVSGFSGL